MSILVLGGAGYIGSHTALELIRTGESVIIADNLATGHIEAVPKDAKFYLGDLHDKAFLDNIFENEQIDAVIHFAAYSLVGESVVNPLSITTIISAEQKFFWIPWLNTILIKLYFPQPLPPMGNRKIFRFLKQTEHSQPIHMVKPNLLWRRCSIGLQKLMV